MQALLPFAMRLVHCALPFFRPRRERTIVQLTLRQQLASYARQRRRPRLTFLDRAFWVALHRLWPRWKKALVIVKPDTVIRWRREGFRLYWRALSRRGPGRPRWMMFLQNHGDAIAAMDFCIVPTLRFR